MLVWVGFVITPWLAPYSVILLCFGGASVSFGVAIMLGILAVSFRDGRTKCVERSV